MARPTEVDSPQDVRQAMIDLRGQALTASRMDLAVLFSHVIAWMSWLIELEGGEV